MTGTGISAPGTPSPGDAEPEECLSRRQLPLPHPRVCLRIEETSPDTATSTTGSVTSLAEGGLRGNRAANVQHQFVALLRQSVYSRLATPTTDTLTTLNINYEDTNDAEHQQAGRSKTVSLNAVEWASRFVGRWRSGSVR